MFEDNCTSSNEKNSMIGVLDIFMSTQYKLESSEMRDLRFRKSLQVVGMSFPASRFLTWLSSWLKSRLMINYYLKHLATEIIFFPKLLFVMVLHHGHSNPKKYSRQGINLHIYLEEENEKDIGKNTCDLSLIGSPI